MVPAEGTRPCSWGHLYGHATGRRIDSSTGNRVNCERRMARQLLDIWIARSVLVGRMVAMVSRRSGRASCRECGRTESHSSGFARAQVRQQGTHNSPAPSPICEPPVRLPDVFCLWLRSLFLSHLVADVLSRSTGIFRNRRKLSVERCSNDWSWCKYSRRPLDRSLV